MRNLGKRLAELEAKAGDVELSRVADAQLVLMMAEAVTEFADMLDATGAPVPHGLLEAVTAADWAKTIKILEAVECEA